MIDKIAAYFTSTVGMVLAGVAASLAVAFGVQTARLGSAQADYRKLETDTQTALQAKERQIGVEKANNVTLRATIETRNKEILVAKEEKAKSDERLRLLKEKYAEQERVALARLQEILSYKPPVGANDYDEAKKQLLELIKERRGR
jgi:hypothetical protein